MPLVDIPLALPGPIPSDGYEVHKLVYAHMNRDRASTRRPFLYGIDPRPIGDSNRGMVIVRTDASEEQATDAIPVAEPALGDVLLFRLTALAGRRSQIGPARWMRLGVPAKTHRERLTWLVCKGRRNGFEPLDPINIDARLRTFRRNGQRLTFLETTFGGALAVTDPDAFKRALEFGVGKGKAFGYGLLFVFPPLLHPRPA